MQATCLVHTYFDATITWLIDGKAVTKTATREKNATHIISNLSVSSTQWENMKNVTCKAEHKCFTSAEKTINIAGKMIQQQENQTCYDQRAIKIMFLHDHPGCPVNTPSVEIRRSLTDLPKRDSAVFECDIKQLSPCDLFIALEVNRGEILEKKHYNFAEGSVAKLSISSQFIVPQKYWMKDQTFTCKVIQGSSKTFHSNSISNIFGEISLFFPLQKLIYLCCFIVTWFLLNRLIDALMYAPLVDPSMELLLVPSKGSESQTLSCSGWSFNPHIKWLSASQERSPTSTNISMSADGRVRVTSQLVIDQSEWKKGNNFTCEVSDRSLNTSITKTISLCSGTVKILLL